MILYRVDSTKPEPIAVECLDPKWPNKDADGRTICDNTHFVSLSVAWAKLQSESDAGVSLSCARVNELRRELAKAEKHLVEATLQAQAVREARKDAERESLDPSCKG